METVISNYRGFVLETKPNGQAMTTIATLNGIPTFGTFSHIEDLSSVEKMQIKIDNFLKTQNHGMDN